MARQRRNPDPPPAQETAPQQSAPDAAQVVWAEKLAQAYQQAASGGDALAKAMQAMRAGGGGAATQMGGLASATAAAAKQQQGLGGALGFVASAQQKLSGALNAGARALGLVKSDEPAAAMVNLAKATNAAEAAQEELAAAKAAAKNDPTPANLNRQALALQNAKKATEELKKAEAKASGMAQGGLAVAAAYSFATAKLVGFVKAGLAGTTAGEALSMAMQGLHRQIASAFLPVIEAGIRKIQQITQWFRSLSGEQQASIARWSGLTVGALGLLAVGPKLISAFTTFGAVLKTTAMSNPFLLAGIGLVALMSRTEEGRNSIKQLGEVMLGAFSKVVEVLGAILIPLIEKLTEFLSGPVGKALLWGTVIVAVGYKVMGVFFAIKAAAIAAGLGISGAFAAATLGVGALIAGVVALLSRSSKLKEFEAEIGQIAKDVRAGRTPQAEAKEQVRQAASGQAYEIQEALKKGGADFWKGLSAAQAAIEKAGIKPPELTFEEQFALQRGGGEGFEEAQRKIVEATQRALEIIGGKKVEEEAKGGKGRSDLVSSRGSTENVQDTIRRIEEASLKSDTLPKQQLEEQKKQTGLLGELQKMIDDMARRLGVEPRPIIPPLPPVLPGG